MFESTHATHQTSLAAKRSRRAALCLTLLGALAFAACSAGPPSLPDPTGKRAQPLEVLDLGVALPITLPESQDPMFSGLTIPPDAPLRGMWSPTRDWPINGLHSVLLPNGRVLSYGTPAGQAATQDGRTFDVWDPAQGFTSVSHRTTYNAQQINSFCSGASFLRNGTLLVSGGNSPLDSSQFSPATGAITTSPDRLADERWYGSMIVLADGRLLMLGGSTPYGALRAYQDPAAAVNAGTVSMTPEIYEPGSGFRSLFGAYSREAFGPDFHRYWYPRAWAAPNGGVFGISSEKMWYLDYSGSGAVRVAGNFKTGVNTSTRPNIGPTSSAVMFAPGRILQVGGNGYHDGHATPSSALATVIDINGAAPVVTEVAPMSFARQWPSATVLPDGRVVVTGGTRYGNNGGADAVYEAELWNPASGAWTTGARAAQIRVYHSAAILMPNGTLLSTGGGAPGPVNNLNAEVYYPPYLFRSAGGGGAELAPRPRMTAVSTLSLAHGSQLDVDVAGATTIQKAILIGASSVTHSFNTSQRRLELPFLQSAGRLAVQLPLSGNDAPPGYYELFLLDGLGVPSNAVLLSLGDSMAPPPVSTLLPRGNAITLQSLPYPDRAVATDAQSLGVLKLLGANPGTTDLASARFIVRDGLADSNCISLEAASTPGQWLRHFSYRIRLAANDGSDTFKADATFCPELGLAGTGFSLRSKNFPTRVLRQRNFELWIDPVATDAGFAEAATFTLREPPLPTLPAIAAPILAAGSTANYAPAISLQGAQFSWNFGDGSEASATSGSPNASHTFAAPGVYLVTLTVRLADGRTVSKSFVQAVRGAIAEGAPRNSSAVALESRPSAAARVWVVNPDSDTVSVIDTQALTRTREIAVGGSPHSVAVAPSGQIWVTAYEPASISVIDPSSLTVARTLGLPVGSRPYGLVFAPNGGSAFVSLAATGQLLEMDATTGALSRTLDVGANPRGLSITASGARLLVSRFVSPPAPGESSASPLLSQAVGEVRIVDLPALAGARVIPIHHSDLSDGPVQGRGIPNYLGAAVISPDAHRAWLPSKQDNIARGTLRDGQNLDFQNTVRAVSSRIDLDSEREVIEERIDHDNAGVASAAVFHPSGVYVFVSLETSRQVAVINALTGSELFRVEVGNAPQGLTLSADGTRLFVQNFMDRSLSAIDLGPLVTNGEFKSTPLATVALVTTEKLASNVLLGKKLFYDARDTRLAKDAYLSCASCHADGADDGRVWDFTGMGEGLRNTISLVGRGGGQGRLHWSANFDEVQDFEGQIRSFAVGTGLLPDAVFSAGTRSQSLGDAKAGLSTDLDALAAYVKSLSRPTPSPFRSTTGLTPAGAAGRELFASRGCVSCHYGSTFSNEDASELKNIGTVRPSSGQRLFGPLLGIDVPSLRDAFASAPYLHDGSASTLSEAITAHQGVTLSETELTQIVEFVRQIDGTEPAVPRPTCTDGVKNGSEASVDCGGSCPLACAVGATCQLASDCLSTLCVAGTCQAPPPSCTDGIKNGSEASIDCGGSCPNACANGASCLVASDCVSASCVSGLCKAAPTCTDGLKNGTETGVDCGGPCSACNACVPTTYQAETMAHSTGGSVSDGWNIWTNGYISTQRTFAAGTTTITVFARGTVAAGVWPNLRLSTGGVVRGNATVSSTAYAAYAFSFTANAGSAELRVEFTNDLNQNGQDRNLYVDRVEIGCSSSPPTPSCSDGIKNGSETAIDCGGSCAADCANGQACSVSADCSSNSCVGGVCQQASGKVSAQLSIQSSWGGGYCANLTVTNPSSSATNTWQVGLNLNQSTITSAWNATFSGTGSLRTVTSNSGSLAAGSSLVAGFCANTTGSNWQPMISSVN